MGRDAVGKDSRAGVVGGEQYGGSSGAAEGRGHSVQTWKVTAKLSFTKEVK